MEISSRYCWSLKNLAWLCEKSVMALGGIGHLGDWLLLLLVELVGGGSVINGAYTV